MHDCSAAKRSSRRPVRNQRSCVRISASTTPGCIQGAPEALRRAPGPPHGEHVDGATPVHDGKTSSSDRLVLPPAATPITPSQADPKEVR
jgi:hypothetical protein